MKTIYYGGAVYTGDLPLAEAFVVENGKFIFAGSNEDALKFEGEQVNLDGKFVCAGFNDSHMHLLNYGQALVVAPLYAHTESLADMIACLKAQEPARGGWIFGRGWNQDYFTDCGRMPNRWDLDEVSAEHPVIAVRACGHALVVNSKALEILGITGDTPQVPGGQIVMEDGQPNGILI